ncbi:MAG: hypothetical protein JSW67_10590 [Candidatus Latescibacterota bacterium]|nr:MAG: hypothetical protein JSW67_10590 [Candidatus Latescibacterota bacterium]
MSIRGLGLVFAAVLALLGCERQPPPALELAPEEQVLVDTYVRLTVLEALHTQSPDSLEAVDAALHALHAELDTTAVRDALETLSMEPLRWERIYDAITRRLMELEQMPETWWSVATGDTSLPSASPSGLSPDR